MNGTHHGRIVSRKEEGLSAPRKHAREEAAEGGRKPEELMPGVGTSTHAQMFIWNFEEIYAIIPDSFRLEPKASAG